MVVFNLFCFVGNCEVGLKELENAKQLSLGKSGKRMTLRYLGSRI